MRVLVTGTSMFFTTRLVQALTANGVDVTVADDQLWSVGKSVPRTKWLRTPSLSQDPAGYLSVLVKELRSRKYDLLLPTFEESLLLAEFREQIEPLTSMFLPSFDVMWQLHHKPSLYRLCCDLGIPTPPTIPCPEPRNLQQQVRSLKFPVVLKMPTGNNGRGREYCSVLPELTERFDALYSREKKRRADTPFVQQKIDGESVYTLMMCHEGRKLGEVIYRPLRSFPTDGGTASHRESIRHDHIAHLTGRIAAATSWSGFLGLDFIVDRADETPYLIDANPRANPAVHLGYLAGVDWTGLLLELYDGRDPTAVSARPDVRSSTPLLDALWLLDGLRPRRNGARDLVGRLRQVFRPGWELHSGHDFMGRHDWLCHVALGWQGLSAITNSLLTNKSVCHSFMSGANYDPLTVDSLRKALAAPGVGCLAAAVS
jgi:hypothetical protein